MLPPGTSAQLAELIALTTALELGTNKRVNIYTDSKYAYQFLCAHAAIWKERTFKTSDGSPIKYYHEIMCLLDARLPKEVAVIHGQGHQKGDSGKQQREIGRQINKHQWKHRLLIFRLPTSATEFLLT